MKRTVPSDASPAAAPVPRRRALGGLAAAAWALSAGAKGDESDRAGRDDTDADPIPEIPEPVEGAPLLIVQPRLFRSEVAVLIPGARNTYFCAARQGLVGAKPYDRVSFQRDFPGGWSRFFAKARRDAAELVKELTPRYRRSPDGIIEYAVLQAEHPLTASTPLAEDFAVPFADTLGPQLYVAMPDRHSVFVFPKLAGSIEKHLRGLADLYDDAIFPASEEFFEVTSDGIQGAGAIRAD